MKLGRQGVSRATLASLALSLAALALSSCGDDCGAPRLTAEELNEEGWGRYTVGEYSGALSSFEARTDADIGDMAH